VKAAVLSGSFILAISLLLVAFRTQNSKLKRAALFLSLASFVVGIAYGLIAYEEYVGYERQFTLVSSVLGYLPLGVQQGGKKEEVEASTPGGEDIEKEPEMRVAQP